MFPKLTILAAAVVLAACQAQPAPKGRAIPVAAAPQPIPIEGEGKPIMFAGLMPALRLGDTIGEGRMGPSCTPTGTYYWTGKLALIESPEASNAFNAELRNANYPIVGASDQPFAKAEGDPELLVAARVTGLTLNYCYTDAERTQASGEIILGIEWQVFDVVTRRTVYKVTTAGRSRLESAVPYFNHRLLYDAVSDATRGLLADARFHALVAGSRTLEQIPPAESSFRLHPRPLLSGTVARNMPDIQAATVTILLLNGHGSGFFISSDGYLLTNAHVVGDAKFVRVRLATGREIAGEAVVVNRVRDVALVKVAESGLTALPISLGEPPIGTDIYAVGTPLDPKSLSTTVTKGIVSAYRNFPEGRMIQGDADVQGGNSGGPLIDPAGNVVGISTAIISGSARKTSVGINFFIPIADALKGVGIELADARIMSPMRMLERPIAVALQPSGPKPMPRAAPEIATPAAPSAPPPSPPPAQVASLAPVAVPAKRDGEYRAKFTATTINGRSYVDLAISIDGETIRGVGRTRGGLQCRANGEVAPDGTAWINVACSNSGSAYLSWQLAGRFAPEKDGRIYVGRLSYANLTGGPGEAVFLQ